MQEDAVAQVDPSLDAYFAFLAFEIRAESNWFLYCAATAFNDLNIRQQSIGRERYSRAAG